MPSAAIVVASAPAARTRSLPGTRSPAGELAAARLADGPDVVLETAAMPLNWVFFRAAALRRRQLLPLKCTSESSGESPDPIPHMFAGDRALTRRTPLAAPPCRAQVRPL
jgi:hypothetical protein